MTVLKNKTLLKDCIQASQLSCPFLTKHTTLLPMQYTIRLSGNKLIIFFTKSKAQAKLQMLYSGFAPCSKNQDVTEAARGHPYPCTPFCIKRKSDFCWAHTHSEYIEDGSVLFCFVLFAAMLCVVMELNFSQWDVRASDVYNFWSMSLKGKGVCLPRSFLHLPPGTWMQQ